LHLKKYKRKCFLKTGIIEWANANGGFFGLVIGVLAFVLTFFTFLYKNCFTDNKTRKDMAEWFLRLTENPIYIENYLESFLNDPFGKGGGKGGYFSQRLFPLRFIWSWNFLPIIRGRKYTTERLNQNNSNFLASMKFMGFVAGIHL
jgi:hypothetical protein